MKMKTSLALLKLVENYFAPFKWQLEIMTGKAPPHSPSGVLWHEGWFLRPHTNPGLMAAAKDGVELKTWWKNRIFQMEEARYFIHHLDFQNPEESEALAAWLSSPHQKGALISEEIEERLINRLPPFKLNPGWLKRAQSYALIPNFNPRDRFCTIRYFWEQDEKERLMKAVPLSLQGPSSKRI